MAPAEIARISAMVWPKYGKTIFNLLLYAAPLCSICICVPCCFKCHRWRLYSPSPAAFLRYKDITHICFIHFNRSFYYTTILKLNLLLSSVCIIVYFCHLLAHKTVYGTKPTLRNLWRLHFLFAVFLPLSSFATCPLPLLWPAIATHCGSSPGYWFCHDNNNYMHLDWSQRGNTRVGVWAGSDKGAGLDNISW